MTPSAETSAYLSNAEIRRAPMESPHVSAAIFPQMPRRRSEVSPPLSWLTSAFSHLESLQRLREDWDGEKSPPPSREIVGSARSFLDNYIGAMDGKVPLGAPQIEPTRVGGILLSWEHGAHELEVDFATSAVATFVYVNHDTGETRSGILCSDNLPPSDDNLKFLDIVLRFFMCPA